MPGRSLDVLRRQYRSVVAGTMGLSPRVRHDTEGEQGWSGQDHVLLALPTDASALAQLQNPDGSFPFMWEYSSWDGPDGWA